MSLSKPDIPNGFSHWCSCVLALRVTQGTLEKYLSEKVGKLHYQLKEKCGDRICKGVHELKYQDKKLCASGDCLQGNACDVQKWIATLHSISRDKNVKINNVNIDDWLTDCKALQVFFMGRGHEGKKCNSLTDAAGLLQLVLNCTAFGGKPPDKDQQTDIAISLDTITEEDMVKIKTILELRNTLMHSSNYELTEDKKFLYYKDFNAFVTIPQFCQIKTSGGNTAAQEMHALALCKEAEQGEIWNLVNGLENTYFLLYGIQNKFDFQCLEFNLNELADVMEQAHKLIYKGWVGIKRDDLSSQQRRELVDKLKDTVEEFWKMKVVQPTLINCHPKCQEAKQEPSCLDPDT